MREVVKVDTFDFGGWVAKKGVRFTLASNAETTNCTGDLKRDLNKS